MTSLFCFFGVVDALIVYFRFKKMTYIKDELIVKEYRQISYKLEVISHESKVQKEDEQKVLDILEKKQGRIEKKEIRRAEVLEIEESKVTLQAEIDVIDAKLSTYDIKELEVRKEHVGTQVFKLRELIWNTSYKELYDHEQEQWNTLKSKVLTLQKELEGKRIIAEKTATEIDVYKTQVNNLRRKQETQKQQRTEISEMVHMRDEELIREEIAKKTKKNIKNKNEKLRVKEMKIDEIIQKNEVEYNSIQQKLIASEEKYQNLETAEIPDLVYVCESVQENMEKLVETMDGSKRAYEDELLENIELADLKELQYSVQQQLKFVKELTEARGTKQLVIDIDCVIEINSIDEQVAAILDEIASLYLEDSLLRENFAENKEHIKKLEALKQEQLQIIMADLK
ncbi:hypothetical protein AwErysi_02370 [Erysipelotrichaceae bacterium]|nr:hypothetical protein AwErysi_02370 [Erysipelotrichaceae bacterium]